MLIYILLYLLLGAFIMWAVLKWGKTGYSGDMKFKTIPASAVVLFTILWGPILVLLFTAVIGALILFPISKWEFDNPYYEQGTSEHPEPTTQG